MIIVDSCGWLEWFADGEQAEAYKPYLIQRDKLLIPVISMYEVYKILKRTISEEKALLAVSYMKQLRVIPLDETLALAAADLSLKKNLAMADAIIVATSRIHQCTIITSDADLKHLPDVVYLPKTG